MQGRHMNEFWNEVPEQQPGETYAEWCERTDRLEKKAEIRRKERSKKRAKARAKRKRTGH